MFIHRIKHEFTTSISPSRVIEQIQSRLPSARFRNDSEFYGYVSDKSFKIRRNLNYNSLLFRYRNSFTPFAIGSLTENESDTTVRLELRMNHLVCMFAFVYEVIVAFAILTGVLECIFGVLTDGIIFVVTGIFMLSFMEVLIFFSFKRPAKRMIERLEEILLFH